MTLDKRLNDTLAPTRLDYRSAGFSSELGQLLAWESVSNDDVQAQVKAILEQVRQRGDQALIEYTCRFDRREVKETSELVLERERLQQALSRIPGEQRNALEAAAQRIRSYHEHQKQESWCYQEEDGTVLGQQVCPMDRVGLYVPGGRAAYPSSVLMNAIPASVAGVPEVVMVVPTPDGEVNELVLAAACIAGVNRVFTVGGAQAIAALAYGTETIPKVDKIVGPGNIYVATAKREVFGQVGIDMIAGPSEILVVCDGQSDPDWVAMDLFSQAEHDEDAQAILISPDSQFLDRVLESMNRLLPSMERKAIILASINDRGAFIYVPDLRAACELTNRIAPEHLELSVENPEACLTDIRHAGAIFMGRYTAEALGDYCA
ncbi:MAG: histidinol dehydrogenase, partial [Endozoicomonas sp.]